MLNIMFICIICVGRIWLPRFLKDLENTVVLKEQASICVLTAFLTLALSHSILV